MTADATLKEQIRHLHDLADQAVAKGELIDAEGHLEAAFELLREAGDGLRLERAVNRDRWGKVHFRLGRIERARELLSEALVLFRQEAGEDDHPVVASALQDLAIAEEAAGAYDTAERHYQQAISIFSRFPQHRQKPAKILSNLAELYLTQGRSSEAEALQRQALELKREVFGEDSPEAANSLHNLGGVVLARGRYVEALELARQAESIRERRLDPDHPERIAGRELLGECLLAMGRYRSAERAFHRALEARERIFGTESPHLALSLHALGNLYRLVGDQDRAEAIYQRALRLKRDQLGDGHPEVALCLHNLANVYTWQGRFDEAARAYEEVLETWSSTLGEDHEKTLYTTQNLADAYRHQGRFERALALLVTALRSLRRTLGRHHPNVHRTMLSLAEVLASRGDLRRADRWLGRVIANWQETLGPRHPDVSRVTARRAQVLAAEERLEEALELLDPIHEIDTVILSEVFSFTTDQQRLLFLEQTRKRLDTHLSISLLALPRGDTAEQRRRRDQALELVLRRKALSTETLLALREALRANPSRTSGERLEQWRQLSSELVRQAWSGAGDSTCEASLRKLQAVEQELARSLPAMALYRVLAEATPAKIAAALPVDGVLVELALVRFEWATADRPTAGSPPRAEGEAASQPAETGERYCAFVVSQQRPERVEWLDLGPAEPIHRALEAWLERLELRREPLREVSKEERGTRSIEAAEDLEKLMVRPLAPFLTEGQRLFIAPDGELHRVAFGALAWSRGLQLIDGFDISYLSTGRDLLGFDRPSHTPPKSPSVVIADPDFELGRVGSQRSDQAVDPADDETLVAPPWALYFRPLPGTAVEGRTVAEILGAQLWMRGDVLESALERLQSPPILHFATHGFFLEPPLQDLAALLSATTTSPGERMFWSQPLLRSGLALAGANGTELGFSPPAEAQDGLLTAMDVAKMNLAHTQLVTLSACESGLGESHRGEVVMGLRRAFLAAGARALVVSLWRVPDLPTTLLMARFYARLSGGERCDRALRQAQRELRELTVADIRWQLSDLPGGETLLTRPELTRISGRGENHQPYRPAFYWAAFICQGNSSALVELADSAAG